MRLDRATHALGAWVAALAMVFSALAPALAQAWADPNAAAWAELCSADGATRGDAESGNAAPAKTPGAMHLLEHCPCCWLHAPALALPPAVWVLAALPAAATSSPATWLQPPRGADAWLSAQPRAPPRSN